MSVIMARVDERLIHGQVALSWLRTYPVDVVIAIDNESAQDTLKTMLLKMAVSGTVTCEVCTVENAHEIIERYKHKKIFLCAKTPHVYKILLQSGEIIPQINIGGIYSKGNRKKYYGTVFLTDEERDEIISLEKLPTVVEYRMLPNDVEINIIEELKEKRKG